MLMHAKPALLGGKPVRSAPFPPYRTIGEEEKRAVNAVLDSGMLSKFLGAWSEDFYGGPRVRALEQQWARYFGVKHAISVNSATSGLYACVGAAGIGPGDEVIVSPYTMSASVAGVCVYGATPVFVDVDTATYCLSPEAIRRALTPCTKAIIAVDLFGHPADFDAIMTIAHERGLTVIEDAAQAPGARYRGRWAGTLGHMGVFSLNYHKTIHAGEGGIIVTDDDDLANRLCLIRNHGEAVVLAKGDARLDELIGFNYRMTELEAAIASEQLKKLDALNAARIDAATYLCDRWAKVPGLQPAVAQPECRHTYYVFAVQHDAQVMGLSRAAFVEAVRAEGVPLTEGYVEPLYRQPLHRRRQPAPSCPVVEALWAERLWYTTHIYAGLSAGDLKDVALAVEKVAEHAKAIASAARRIRKPKEAHACSPH